MKKFSLLLAVLLVIGLFAGCTPEAQENAESNGATETKSEADALREEREKWREQNTGVPGYNMFLPLDTSWELNEETIYDLEMAKDGVTVAVIAFTPGDFEEMPTAEELYERCNNILFKELQELTTLEEKTSYEVEDTKITTQLFSAKDGDVTKQYYCFLLEFADDAGSVAWVSFTAEESVMTQKKAELKAIAEAMKSDEVAEYDPEAEDLE